MAKAQRTKKADTFIDMTAMSDVTVLLLTFFMLTATFKPLEPKEVITPASVSETTIPEHGVLTIMVDEEGRSFIHIDDPAQRMATARKMGEHYGVQFTGQQMRNLELGTHIGVPINMMSAVLDMPPADQYKAMESIGIPVDTANNQLGEWIRYYKEVNEDGKLALKAARETPFPKVDRVMSTLVEVKENRYSLVTVLRGMPEGL